MISAEHNHGMDTLRGRILKQLGPYDPDADSAHVERLNICLAGRHAKNRLLELLIEFEAFDCE